MRRNKTSISKRLFKHILLIVLAFAFVMMLSNTLLLRPLYRHYMKEDLTDNLAEIMALDFSADSDEWTDALYDIQQGSTFEVLIYDDLDLIYASNEQSKWMGRGMGRQMGMHHDEIIQRIKEGKAKPEIVLEEVRARGPVKDVLYKTGEKDGYTIILTQVMDAIDRTIVQSNMVVASVTLLFLVGTLFIAFMLARSFTKPIKSMQATVNSITKLNFDKRCDVSTGDELEHLASDINSLSSQLKNTLATLKKQNEQLEKDIVSQRQFISNASHELRTPLSLVKGYADELAGGYISDPDHKQMVVGIIGEEADKMNRLLKEMLDLSRMESGRMQLDAKALNVGKQIKEFVDKYDGYIAEKHLDVTLKLETTTDVGVFDPMRFEQVLANYLSNAAKYGDDARKVVISTQIGKESIRINLFNSGTPLNQDALDNIWERFYKQDQSRTQDDASYGLGLSIVAAIQSLSGQAFGAKNDDGGVSFWFEVKREL